MKLENHRRDVKFLKKLGENRLSLRPIAERYLNLIRMAEESFEDHKSWDWETTDKELQVLKDAGVK